jgi:hypothetical protein
MCAGGWITYNSAAPRTHPHPHPHPPYPTPQDTPESRAARDRLLSRRHAYRPLPIEALVAYRRELPEYNATLVTGATLLVKELEPPAPAASAAPAAAAAAAAGAVVGTAGAAAGKQPLPGSSGSSK